MLGGCDQSWKQTQETTTDGSMLSVYDFCLCSTPNFKYKLLVILGKFGYFLYRNFLDYLILLS